MSITLSSDDEGDGLLKANLPEGTSMSSRKNKLNKKEHTELQRVVAVFAYDSNMDTSTLPNQWNFVYDVFHGHSTNSVSQVQLLVQGVNP